MPKLADETAHLPPENGITEPLVHFTRLDAVQRPLLNKFYKMHRSSMRASGELAWVARRDSIIAALNLTRLPEGYWLTGLYCAATERGNRIASRLIQAVQNTESTPIWLFCEAPLQGFYQRLGFSLCHSLPALLSERLSRYRRTRDLHAMCWQPPT